MRIPSYDDELLHLAEDLARRMLPAFDTPTGILCGVLLAFGTRLVKLSFDWIINLSINETSSSTAHDEYITSMWLMSFGGNVR